MRWLKNTVRIFLTMRCNNNCSYCTNLFHINNRDKSIVSGKMWVNFLQDLNGVGTVIFSGGEPTLHPDFAYIVDNIQFLKTVIYSNGSNFAIKKIKELEYRDNIVIDLSYHYGQIPYGDYLNNMKVIKGLGFKFTSYTVCHPDFEDKLMRDVRRFVEDGFTVGIKPFDGVWDNKWYSDHTEKEVCMTVKPRTVLCKVEYPIGPKGNIFRCHRFLYGNDSRGIISNIFTQSVNYIECKYRKCNYYGQCNPCETKQKVKELNSG